MPSATIPAIAIITGTFLSGASLSNNWFSLPILLNTLTTSSIKATLRSFSLLQDYADPIFPLGALSATLLHWTHAYRLFSGTSEGWKDFAYAGAATFCMIPFSLAVVFPTVWKIEAVQKRVERSRADGEEEGKDAEVREVRELLKRWNTQHMMRGLMPLVGAVVGLRGMLKQVGA